MRVAGKVAVVTGASSGIGRAAAVALARRGATVVLAARREEALAEAARECEAHGARALVVPTDVTDADAVQELADAAVDAFGRLDIWVNAAAVSVFAPLESVPLEDFRRVLDVNVMGYVHGTRSALREFRARGRGVLVNVSSIVGVVPQPYTHAYTMSKAAVRQLSGSVRQQLKVEGVRGIDVVSVLPATIDTPFFSHAANYTGRKAVAMPPVYSPQRVARAIVGAVRRPRRELVVGPLGKGMVGQYAVAPGLVERAMARQVHRSHLSRKESAPPSSGNLFSPAPGHGAVTGGWSGRRRTAMRRLTTVGLLAGAGAVMLRRARR